MVPLIIPWKRYILFWVTLKNQVIFTLVFLSWCLNILIFLTQAGFDNIEMKQTAERYSTDKTAGRFRGQIQRVANSHDTKRGSWNLWQLIVAWLIRKITVCRAYFVTTRRIEVRTLFKIFSRSILVVKIMWKVWYP